MSSRSDSSPASSPQPYAVYTSAHAQSASQSACHRQPPPAAGCTVRVVHICIGERRTEGDLLVPVVWDWSDERLKAADSTDA